MPELQNGMHISHIQTREVRTIQMHGVNRIVWPRIYQLLCLKLEAGVLRNYMILFVPEQEQWISLSNSSQIFEDITLWARIIHVRYIQSYFFYKKKRLLWTFFFFKWDEFNTEWFLFQKQTEIISVKYLAASLEQTSLALNYCDVVIWYS